MQTIDLNGAWRVKVAPGKAALPRGLARVRRWMNATVPGVIHMDLLREGVILDPFVGMNEKEVQWVAEVPWIYRRQFHVPASLLDEGRVELVADGLDTFADIFVNGRRVGSSWNMFTAQRFDVRRFLLPGANSIEIRFESPVARAKALEQLHGRLQVDLEPHRVHVRKAQYSFGWDWGPRLTTSGIWRPIRLEAYSHGRLRDPFVRVLSIRRSQATIRVSAHVESRSRRARTLRLQVQGHGAGVDLRVPVSGRAIETTIRLDRAHFWWPNRYGSQPMYMAVLTLFEGTRAVDVVKVPFAVRTIRLIQEADAEGRSFIMEINGRRVFCKGADWIPADTFLPRIKTPVYEALLGRARDASMNIIRVWGGGIYEDDTFYDLCDRLGLMVWQDFMYACGEYPDHKEFLREARREAEEVVFRLRNHPCIVLWCGNNECEWGFCQRNPGQGVDRMRGAPIFRDVLPGVVRRLDGTRPYWRSTPFGRGFPNDEGNGNHHQWDVWSGWKDFTEYRQNSARFVSEFGFQGPANRRTMERVLEPAERSPQSPAMEHHNKQVEGTERLFRFLAAHFRTPTRWQAFLHAGQVLQGEALKCAVEHWRRRKFGTAGAIFWQLNDCWPVTSWSVIDSELRPKAAYYYAKRFYAPVLVSIVGRGEDLEIWGSNDTLSEVEGRLRLALCSVQGATLWRKEYSADIPRNKSALLHRVPGVTSMGADPRSTYLRAELCIGTQSVSVNRHFFVEYKHLQLVKPRIRVQWRRVGREMAEATLTSSTLALAVELSAGSEGIDLDDNFVTLDSGIPSRVCIRGAMTLGKLRRKIIVRPLQY